MPVLRSRDRVTALTRSQSHLSPGEGPLFRGMPLYALGFSAWSAGRTVMELKKALEEPHDVFSGKRSMALVASWVRNRVGNHATWPQNVQLILLSLLCSPSPRVGWQPAHF